jgi:hypothetical protein
MTNVYILCKYNVFNYNCKNECKKRNKTWGIEGLVLLLCMSKAK